MCALALTLCHLGAGADSAHDTDYAPDQARVGEGAERSRKQQPDLAGSAEEDRKGGSKPPKCPQRKSQAEVGGSGAARERGQRWAPSERKTRDAAAR